MKIAIYILLTFFAFSHAYCAYYQLPEGSKLQVSKEKDSSVEIVGELKLTGIIVFMKNYNYDDEIYQLFVPDEKSKNKLPQGSLGLGMPINLGKWYEVLIPNEIQNKLLSSKIYTIMVPVTVTANKYIIVNECSHVSMYITDISKAETHGEFSIPTKKYDRNDCG